MQDYLGLGMEARMNAPGTLGGNWLWRMTPGAIPASLAPRLAAQAAASHRAQQRPMTASAKPQTATAPTGDVTL